MQEKYINDYTNKKNKFTLSNPLYRIKYTHNLTILILLVNAFVFTYDIFAQIIQIVLAIVIYFHDLDDQNLKESFSVKIKDLKEHEENLQNKIDAEVQKNEDANQKIIEQLQASKKIEKDLDAQKYALDQHAIVATTDIHGNITYVNDKFTKISGYSQEELIGQNHRILNSGTHDTEFWTKMYNDLLHNKTWHSEVCNKAKDGSLYWVDTTIVSIHNTDGEISSYIGIRADITEKKADEIALRKAKLKAEESAVAKSEFLASMSHEIRTPLNAILGFVSILQKTKQEEKSKDYLNIIDTSGKSLLTIINDILDFSKMQSGKFDIDKQDVCPLEELSNTIMLFSSNAYAKHHTFSVYIDPNLPITMHLDIVRVNQILSNLLSNAIKFTPMYGSLNVTIIYKNANLVISVEDSGIGIAKENIDKIFSAFSQADSSTTRKYGGTGLGLSISSILSELMSGTLRATSEEGTGSTFTLTLPAKVIKSEALELINKDNISTLRVAILHNCDECKNNVTLLQRYLNDFGITSVLSLDTYQKEGYDVLFFVPDDEYNDDIVEAEIPAIAMLKDDTIEMKHLEHIVALYAPFLPKSIVEVLDKFSLNSTQITTNNIENSMEEEEIEFKGNILVAEDNVTNQMLIKLLLMDYGVSFVLANDGVEAVEKFKKGKFDMILMDENMPNMNGIEAMKEIKEYEKENSLSSVPIVALTANALESDRVRFKDAGMDGFIAKPIDTKALEEELHKYLEVVS